MTSDGADAMAEAGDLPIPSDPAYAAARRWGCGLSIMCWSNGRL